MKKYFSFIFIVLPLFLSAQKNSSTFEKSLEEILADNFFTSTIPSIEIYNSTADKLIYSKNSKLLLRPASNQKIITSLAALYFLDSDYTFKTSLYYHGNVIDSTLSGDIFIVGGADPEFTSRDMDFIITKIQEAGIKNIDGNLYGDISMFDSVYWGEGWMWDDNPNSFSPYLSPLIVDKSNYKIKYAPGEIGSPAVIEVQPYSNYPKIINTSITVESGKSDFTITRDWLNSNDNIIVKGALPDKSGQDSLLLNISKPYMFFLNVLKEKITNSGIGFKGSIDTLVLHPDASHLYTFHQPVDTVLFYMNKDSDNLNAEMVLRALANKYSGKRCSARDGIKLIDSLLIMTGLNPKDYRMVDGSGLSFYNLVSTEMIIKLMKHTQKYHPDLFSSFISTLPLGGVDGTLKRRFSGGGCFNNIRAKTGTISGTSSLSGIIKSKKGDEILFSIFLQNYVGSARYARRIIDKICNIIYDQL